MMPGNGSERVMPLDIRTDQVLPAFTNCSLDDDPGNGDPASGDQAGQANRWLYWDDHTLVDTADRLEMTVALMDKAPAQDCAVDITPAGYSSFMPCPALFCIGKIPISVAM